MFQFSNNDSFGNIHFCLKIFSPKYSLTVTQENVIADLHVHLTLV